VCLGGPISASNRAKKCAFCMRGLRAVDIAHKPLRSAKAATDDNSIYAVVPALRETDRDAIRPACRPDLPLFIESPRFLVGLSIPRGDNP
jgi:hypothetical protein